MTEGSYIVAIWDEVGAVTIYGAGILQVEVTWGDGSADESFNFGAVAGYHTYEPGDWNASVAGAEQDGTLFTATGTLTIVPGVAGNTSFTAVTVAPEPSPSRGRTMHQAEMVSWIAVTRTRDALGNGTATDAAPVLVPAVVAGRTSSEHHDDAEADLLVGKTVYLLDPTVEPGPNDRLEIRGLSYDVDGEAHRWGSHGTEVNVKRTGARA